MLTRILILLLICGSQATVARQNAVTETPTPYNSPGSPMPPFLINMQEPLQVVDASTKFTAKPLTDKNVKNDANLFVMLFNPTCDHCEDQTMMMEQNIGLFKKSNIVLICSKTNKQFLNNFLLITHKKDYPKINVGMDSTDFVQKTLLYSQMPQLNIYDHNRKLIKIFSGATPIDSFKMYIE